MPQPWDRHRQIAEGIVHMPSRARLDRLTDWQLLVLEMLGRGLEPKHISAVLRRSISSTYETIQRIKFNLGTDLDGVLVRCAVEWGLVRQFATVSEDLEPPAMSVPRIGGRFVVVGTAAQSGARRPNSPQDVSPARTPPTRPRAPRRDR